MNLFSINSCQSKGRLFVLFAVYRGEGWLLKRGGGSFLFSSSEDCGCLDAIPVTEALNASNPRQLPQNGKSKKSAKNCIIRLGKGEMGIKVCTNKE
jgi:hypothetical protein